VSESLGSLLAGATRIAVLGVGSELRADDVVGLLVARRIAEAFPGSPSVLAIEGATAPENFTGQILRFAPSHLVVVDCADLGEAPGSARIFPPSEISGASSNTHTLPLKIIVDYLNSSHPCQTIVVGIAPRSLAFLGEVAPEVEAAAQRIAAELSAAVRSVDAAAG
jgi:hydrogenase 3 maturation protease